MASAKRFVSPTRWLDDVRSLPQAELILLVNTFVSCIGFGLYTAVGVIYFSRFAGVSVVQVGLGFSLTASVWLLAAAPVGRLVDRVGPKEMTIGAGALQGLMLACLPLIDGFTVFLVFMCTLGVVERTASVSREALLAQVVDEQRRVLTAAKSRSLANVGLAVGNALAAITLSLDTRGAFVVTLLGYAALIVLCSIISTRYPHVPGRPAKARSGPRGVFRDPPFLAVAVLSGLISIYDVVLVVGLPLWIAHHTSAPTSLFAALMVTNTVLVVLFQVRAARNVTSVVDARRALIQGCGAAAVACAAFGVAGMPGDAAVAAAVLAGGLLVLTAGELRASAADWTLRFELARPDAQGEYGAIHSIGATIRSICGPVLVTTLLSTWTEAGWLVLVGLFLAFAALTGPVVAWSERTRDRYAAVPPEPGPATPAAGSAGDRVVAS